MGAIKNEIYEEVHDEIYAECFDDLTEAYRNNETFVAEVQSELRAALTDKVVEQLRLELRVEVLEALTAEMRADLATLSQIKDRLTAEIYQEIRGSFLRRP